MDHLVGLFRVAEVSNRGNFLSSSGVQPGMNAAESGALTSNAKSSAEKAQGKFLQARVPAGNELRTAICALTGYFEGRYSGDNHAPKLLQAKELS
jgi:hypothetical protein